MAVKTEAAPSHVDYAWKIILGGAGGVGKSTLIHRYIFKEFKEDMVMTIGCSHHSQYISKGDRTVNLIIWDLGGQKRFEILHPAYVGGAHAGYVLFDMSHLETLEESDKWINLIRKYNAPGIPVILVGTKCDLLASQSQLDGACTMASKIVADNGLAAFIVTSSKLNLNIDETIEYLIDYLLWKNGT
jgi:Ras-related protein Rab-5C